MSDEPAPEAIKKFPSCPPKVKTWEVQPAHQAANDSDLKNQHNNNNMQALRVVPWWSKYSGYQKLRAVSPSRTRRTLPYILSVTAICLVTIIVWLYRSGRLGGGGFHVKKSVSVRLPQGTYSGEINSKSDTLPRAVEAFRGIPYAQTTAGDNRFKAPQPLTNLDQPDVVFQATNFGGICPQGSSSAGQDEDCLNLNVFRPHFGDNTTADALDMARLGGQGTPLPVAIYVHGGGFNSGYGKERNMGSFVSWADMPIIGISFNYRVGALGFLPSAVTKKAGLLNLGLKDQQMLFAWVQKNIAAFGGDPDNVTIMGLSAGGHSIGHHLVSYAPANRLTDGPVPFHKAILESGATTARAVFAPTHPLHEQQFQEFLLRCGLGDTPDEEIFVELRKLSISNVMAASYSVWRKYYSTLRWAFQPSIDGPGGIIPDLPIQSWQKGNVLHIPIITGFDTNEGTIFVPKMASNASALSDLMSPLIPALNKTDIKTMEDMYPDPDTQAGRNMYIVRPPLGFGKQFWRLDDAYAHYAYICPVLQTAHYASISTSETPVFVYHYAARSPPYGGTSHSDEAPMVAHDMGKIKDLPGLSAAADAMNGAWTRFAAFGSPNPTTNDGKSSFKWSRFFSPFANSTSDSGANNAEKGQVALFAMGNDENMGSRGRHNLGVPWQVVDLTEREMNECNWWWDRAIYSEGFGNGSLTF